MSDNTFIERIRAAGPGEHYDRSVKIANPEDIGNAQPVAALPTPGEEWRNVLFRLTTDNLLYYLNDAGTGWVSLDRGAPSEVISVNGQTGEVELDASDIPNDSTVPGTTTADALDYLLAGSGSGGSWQQQIRDKCEAVAGIVATDTLTGTGATDLQTAINALDDGDVLEIQTDATYSPIVLPAGKEITIIAGAGYFPKITGQNGITLVNGCEKILIAGLILQNCTTADANGKGASICLAHQAIVSDITFYDCAIKITNGSGVMLSFHQTISGDNYATASTLAEMSFRVAFIGCAFSRAGTDKTEGGNLCARGVQQMMVENCQVDAQNLTRGISLQNCVDAWIARNVVVNCSDGNGGEAVKFDSIGTPSGYRIGGVVIGNRIQTAREGIDVDDTTSMLAIYDNIISDCVEDGISLDGGSSPANGRAAFVGNVCFRCGNGILLEAGSVAELTRNVCFGNTTNFNIQNGYTLDATNTESPADAPQAGDEIGPASAVDGNLTAFDGATGRRLKDSGKKVTDFDEAVTVGASGCTFTTLNAAIDHCAARKGGTIIIRDQIHNYTAGTAKDVSNIVFVGGGGDQVNGPGMIFWNSGAGAWTGNNVTFRNLLIRGRPGSSGSLLTPTGILGTGGAVVFCENCQFIIDGSTSPSLATSLFNLNSLNARVYLHNTTCTRAAPGNRAIFSGDANAEFFLTGRSILTGATPKTVYRDGGSTVLFGTVTTNTLIDSDANVANTSTVAGATVKAALDALNALAGQLQAVYTGNDAPGSGSNTLSAGQSRIWHRVSDNRSFLVTNAAGTYRLVEMTDYA